MAAVVVVELDTFSKAPWLCDGILGVIARVVDILHAILTYQSLALASREGQYGSQVKQTPH